MTTVTEAVPYGDLVHLPVHFDDLDAMGLLHNTRYAVLVERAVVQWWTERGVTFAGSRSATPDAFNVVREFAITYHRPVRGMGAVGVHFWLERMGSSSAEYGFRVISADGATVFAEGRRVHVRLDPATMRPAAWTEAGRAIGSALLRG